MPGSTKKVFATLVVILLVASILIVPISSDSEVPNENLINASMRFISRFYTTTIRKEATVILTGDVMLGRTVMTTSLDKGDPTYPFLEVADTLRGADLVFFNLENPIVENCPRQYESLVFCASPEMIGGLIFSKVDVVTLANNHTGNYGESGLEETRDRLLENGIVPTGLGDLIVSEVNGMRFGLLGFSTLENFDQERALKLVSRSDDKVDVLIVGMHWGAEYTSEPSEGQRELARKLIDSGADVIAGHHSHWVQTMEKIKNKPVYYSLGNFVFDQMWSENTKKGMVVRLKFVNGKLESEEILSTYMKNWAQPEFVEN